ncbi:glycosyltransferase [Radicibacter daui]|uniref:glycosyltransferase n=1 Tax=Radicibacter daui TaxID=3064829 RepID=UPI004046F46A
MRILIIHERYQQRGGEDEAVDADIAFMAAHGFDVGTLIKDNAEIGPKPGLALAAATVWSRQGYRLAADAIRRFQPDIVHVHNSFPLFSPSVIHAARAAGVPVVQTLHNYRLLCVNGLLLRAGHACERCVGQPFAWPGVVHGCYRGSRPASAAVAAMAASHRLLGTWSRKVSSFIALSEFAAARFRAAGLPPDRLEVIPNPVDAPTSVGSKGAGSGALYVGRLSPEKGVRELLELWRHIEVPLQIVGDGPLEAELKATAPGHVSFLGRLPREAVASAMAAANFLVFPSLCFENLPLAICEAMAHGLPVIAASGGAAGEMVEHGRSGYVLSIADRAGWRAAATTLFSDKVLQSSFATNARRLYEKAYAPAEILGRRNALYDRLMRRR